MDPLSIKAFIISIKQLPHVAIYNYKSIRINRLINSIVSNIIFFLPFKLNTVHKYYYVKSTENLSTYPMSNSILLFFFSSLTRFKRPLLGMDRLLCAHFCLFVNSAELCNYRLQQDHSAVM